MVKRSKLTVTLSPAVVAVLAWATLGLAAESVRAQTADWIWSAQGEVAYFHKTFSITGPVKKAELFASCDNQMQVFLNGKAVAASDSWEIPVKKDLTKAVNAGVNVFAVIGKNAGGPSGLIVELDVTLANGKKQTIVTDKSWLTSPKEATGWQTAAFKADGWKPAVSLGKYGVAPWGTLPKAGGGGGAPISQTAHAPKGFKVELIYTVPKAEQGSWVSLTALPDGRLVASDQGNQGLFYITPPKLGDDKSQAKVEKMPVNISNAQGMTWAFNSLYVNRNGGGSGLWRVTDSNGDGALDNAEQLIPIAGGGEHGPHAVIQTEDGKGLFVVAGNHTRIPDDLIGGRQPMNWAEDLLLPRQWDANGHARGILAPGGWICRVNPQGKNRQLFSNGYRNCYDIAINRDGEMFTYDSDMEWDIGSPWYRPTRVCHITSGSEFGWRSGTGKWPPFYPDSLPPVVDIGPGSPVGVVFGYGTRFPAKWQEALYILDWTYGTIWAIHLTPEGSSYSAKVEEFVSGAPLPVTDAIVGKDGVFYFTVGGRGTQSALYRVTYTGDESTAPSRPVVNNRAAELRRTRHMLEAFHGRKDPKAVAAALGYLGHEDRFIRFAARLALEAQPVSQWQSQVLALAEPEALITGMVALARQGKPDVQNDVLTALGRLDLAKLPQPQLLEALRAYELAFIRLGKPTQAWRKKAIALFDPLYPHASDDANHELVQLLVYLDAPTVIEKTMKLIAENKPTPDPNWATVLERNRGYGGTVSAMLANKPPIQGIWYAFTLRNVRYGWTIPQREAYFQLINEASRHPGGASYPGYLRNIRAEALANCSEAERRAVANLTGESLDPLPPFKVTPPKGPGQTWTTQSALAAVDAGLKGRSFENGRNVFHAVGCVKCHRFDGAGGAVGPDLSSVGNKFGYPDVLEAILEPSKVISDQYASFIVTNKDGESFTGLVIDADPNDPKGVLEIYTSDLNAEPIKVKKTEVDAKRPSPISQMPTGLVNVLNKNEFLDLLAYLMSRGDKNAAVFK